MAYKSPLVQQRRLARELRQLREAAHMTIDQAAERLYCSGSKVSRIEKAQVKVALRDVRDLLLAYGITGERFDELMRLAREARGTEPYREFQELPNVTLADLEAGASWIRMYNALVVPGLLQTADYARAILRAVRPDTNTHPEELEPRVGLRMARQRRLAEQEAPKLLVVLDEAVLRRPIGGPEVMRAQIERLVDVAERSSNVTLQVVPFAAGGHAGLDGTFMILRFPNDASPDIVYLENARRDAYFEDEEIARRYQLLFDHVSEVALDTVGSAAFLASVAKEL